jgi:hypothetical protein
MMTATLVLTRTFGGVTDGKGEWQILAALIKPDLRIILRRA